MLWSHVSSIVLDVWSAPKTAEEQLKAPYKLWLRRKFERSGENQIVHEQSPGNRAGNCFACQEVDFPHIPSSPPWLVLSKLANESSSCKYLNQWEAVSDRYSSRNALQLGSIKNSHIADCWQRRVPEYQASSAVVSHHSDGSAETDICKHLESKNYTGAFHLSSDTSGGGES